MIKLINVFFEKKVSAIGLAWFRVFYLMFFLNDVHELYINSHLIFDAVPFYWPLDVSVKLILLIWMLSISMMILGLFTRFNAVFNYILTVFLISTLSQFEYHIYYVYAGVNLLLIFIPINRVFSLDNLIFKLKNSSLGKVVEVKPTTTVWSYWLIPFVGIGLIYWGSVFYKLNDPIWLNGLGLWYPASFPVATNIPMPWLLDNEILIKFLGYFALIFELIFIFIFWFKPLRLWVSLVGIIFHIGIYLFFPIPNFALAVASLYVLCIPIKFWSFTKFFSFRSPLVTVYYDGECPLCFRTRLIIEHFDVLHAIQFKICQSYYQSDLEPLKITLENALNDLHGIDNKGKLYKGFSLYRQILLRSIFFAPLAIFLYVPVIAQIGNWIYRKVADNRHTLRCDSESCVINIPNASSVLNPNEVKLLNAYTVGNFKSHLLFVFLVVFTSIQMVVVYFSPACDGFRQFVRKFQPIDSFLEVVNNNIVKNQVKFTGITGHDVFIKSHFETYQDALKITFVKPDGNEITLPYTDDSGKPIGIIKGCVWANYCFRFMNPDVSVNRFLFGLRRYTANWLMGTETESQYNFRVYTKKITVPMKWESGIQTRELSNKDWHLLGTIKWKNKVFEYQGEVIDNGIVNVSLMNN